MQFIDLISQRKRLGARLDTAMLRVLDSGAYIMGPEVHRLEEALAAFTGAKHALTCSSGTDAMVLSLRSLGLRSHHAVIAPSFTFASTPESIAVLGALPVFADVRRDSFNLDPAGLEAAVAAAEQVGREVRGIIAVDLFGQAAEHDAIRDFAQARGLWVLDDAAQAFGATWQGRRLGTLAQATTTSFFPAKPLGCYGDGGALFTDDDRVAEVAHSCRNHGQGRDRYENVRLGMTGRMDTLQAAVLLEKLSIYEEELAARTRAAKRYGELLDGIVAPPAILPGADSVWAQYTVLLPAGTERERLRNAMQADGVPTAVYYLRPMHRQQIYQEYPIAAGGLPNTDWLAGRVLSLPMHAYLTEEAQLQVVASLKAALAAQGKLAA